MRASMALEALSAHYRVVVVHAELWAGRTGLLNEAWVRSRSLAYFRIRPDRFHEIRPLLTDFLSGVPHGAEIDAVYAFRQDVAPIAMRCFDIAGARPRVRILDLDDDECARNLQLAPLYETAGNPDRAERVRAELLSLSSYRSMLMPYFNYICLASPVDCANLGNLYPAIPFVHLPNAVRVPEVLPRKDKSGGPRLLFVGTLDYLPNEDAVVSFARDTLPLILAKDPITTLRVVGAGFSPALLQVAQLPGVHIVGAVPELGPEYAAADAMVVPIRAGSGTRIKILEAFCHQTPVISSTKGAEGLSVVDGEHLLIADSPTDFADACRRLLTDPELGRRLTTNALEFVVRHHSEENVQEIITEMLRYKQ